MTATLELSFVKTTKNYHLFKHESKGYIVTAYTPKFAMSPPPKSVRLVVEPSDEVREEPHP